MATVVGCVIGSGVFSLIGIGIGYTGKSAWIGILLSAVFILLQALPFIVMAGTARFRGGYYSMMGTLWGPKFAGFYIVIFFASNVSLAMYAISFAQYLQGVLPQVPIVPVAVACLTVFFITNLLGIEGAAKLEIVMDIVLALAMTCFIVFGLPKVDYSTLFTVDFAPAGPMGIITCAVLLTWATAGGIDMVNLSAEAKNPTKDLPQVILVATIAIAIFYALIAMVAGGVLPVSETANQPLDLVARAIMPTPVFLFFVIGGALLALTTTLNATFAWITKPILQACNDGWLPHKIGYIHPKFQDPRHYPGGLLYRGPHSHPDRPADQHDRRHRRGAQQHSVRLHLLRHRIYPPAHAGALGGLRLPLQQEQALPEVHSGRRVLRGHGAGALLPDEPAPGHHPGDYHRHRHPLCSAPLQKRRRQARQEL